MNVASTHHNISTIIDCDTILLPGEDGHGGAHGAALEHHGLSLGHGGLLESLDKLWCNHLFRLQHIEGALWGEVWG